MKRRPAASLPLLLAAALAAAAGGCASGTGGRGAARPPGAATPPRAAAAPALPAAWEMPAGAYGSQILYRVAVSGAEGDASLKLILRLAGAARYQAQAVDPLGRAVWDLDVDGDHGRWIDHRGHTWCRLDGGAFDLAFLPLGPLSLSALPALLLGRLPVPPASPGGVVRGGAGAGAAAGVPGMPAGAGETVSYRDAAGRGWSAVVQGGQIVSWGLWLDAGAAPALSWSSSGAWAVLSDHRKGVQVRWREAVREPLGPLPRVAPRADDREGSCTAAPPHPGGR